MGVEEKEGCGSRRDGRVWEQRRWFGSRGDSVGVGEKGGYGSRGDERVWE